MDNEPNAEKKARRHAVLMRGVVTPILGLLAVAAIGLGIMNATEWKPSRTITAQTQVSGSRYVVTDPGVAGLVDSDVRVKVLSGGSGKVCVAAASAKDAAGWLSGERYVRLTGLDDWQTLGTQKAGSSAGQNAGTSQDGTVEGVDFKDSDMWHAVTCDTKSVEFESNVKNDSTVLLVDLGEKQNADISFTWTRKTLPDFATPFYFVGGLLAVGAVLTASVFAMPPHRRRHRMVMGTAGQLDEHTDQQAEEPVEEVSIREALTGSMSSLAAAFQPSKRGGRRHAAAAGEDVEQPTVIDPSARNLVADAAGAAADDDDMSVGEETSVKVFSHFIPLQSAGCAIQSESKFYYSAALPNVQIYEKADALQNGKHRLYAGFYLLQYSFPTQPEQLPLQQEPFLRFLWIFRTAHIA